MNMESGQHAERRAYRMVARAEAAETTRARILHAARELFGELPYEEVSLGAVAARSEVTVQTVRRRFGSKEDLFAAVATWRLAEIRGIRDAAPAGDLGGAIQNLSGVYERWGDEMLHWMAQERRTSAIRELIEFARAYHHAWVRRVFTPWLEELTPGHCGRRLAQLIAATDVYTWKILRRDLGLRPDETEAAILELTERILQQSPQADG